MNLVDLLGKLSVAMNNPFAIHWTEYSAQCLLFFTMGYGIVALTVTSSRKNRRRGAEHGSAQWGDVFQIAKRYRDCLLYTSFLCPVRRLCPGLQQAAAAGCPCPL